MKRSHPVASRLPGGADRSTRPEQWARLLIREIEVFNGFKLAMIDVEAETLRVR
jgi:hypothetical protein